MFREEDLRKISSHYGIVHQTVKCIEEMSELTKELSKHLDGRQNKGNIEEEIADVMVMLHQMMLLLKISEADILYQMNLKIKRTMEALDREADV